MTSRPRGRAWTFATALAFAAATVGASAQAGPAATNTRSQASTEGLARIVEHGSTPTIIAQGHRFTEGPVWVPAASPDQPGFLLYTDIPNDTIHKLSVGAEGSKPPFTPEVWLNPAGHANGLSLDPQGRVLIAMHDGRVARWAPRPDEQTEPEILCEKHDGKQLNSPNDLVAAGDGTIYFTDPPYGLGKSLGSGKRKRELDFCGVYRLSATGELTLEYKDIPAPNGVALSPDGGTLYVADTGSGKIFAFGVNADGSLAKPRLFARNDAGDRASFADGLRVDVEGNLYSAGPGGVWVWAADGKKIGVIETHRAPTNLCFGGDDFKTLFATTRDSVVGIPVKIAGLPPGSVPGSAPGSAPNGGGEGSKSARPE